ncbi:MAG: CAP domain-containing protein [Chloroflexota bacterium]
MALIVIFCANLQTLYAQDNPIQGNPILNSAPHYPEQAIDAAEFASPQRYGLAVNLSDRQESMAFYQAVYLPSNDIPSEWDGDVANCVAGSTSSAFRQAVVRRINYFRAMAGIPADVVLSEEYNRKAQLAALMMSANEQLDHTPPDSWDCYTDDGAEAAGSSNLYLGVSSAESIDGYIRDPGDSNAYVGHRTWILYPQIRAMGTGDIPRTEENPEANALWVFDNLWEPRPATREEFVSWPPPGYVPYMVVYPRWSFSFPDADFSEASVSVMADGVAVPLAVEAASERGRRSVLVWRMNGMGHWDQWAQPAQDMAYNVTISNVKIGEQTRTFDYQVMLFDPDVAGDEEPPVMLNHAVGAPGSFFTVIGRDFAPNISLEVNISQRVHATIQTDDQGRFTVVLDSDGIGRGTLTLSVTSSTLGDAVRGAAASSFTSTTASGVTYLTIDPAAPRRVQEIPANSPPPFMLMVEQEYVYLPFIPRE